MNTWYSRVDKLDRPGLRALRPRPVAGRSASRRRIEVGAPRKQSWTTLGSSRSPRRAARTGSTCSSRSSGARRTTTRASSRRSSAGRSPDPPRARHDEWSKAKRRGVLIDANQNGEGKTIASVYSCGTKEGRAGLDAAALGGGRRALDPAAFTMDVVRRGCRARRSLRRRAEDEAVVVGRFTPSASSGYPATVRCFGKGGAR
jgi:hypothetical protein